MIPQLCARNQGLGWLSQRGGSNRERHQEAEPWPWVRTWFQRIHRSCCSALIVPVMVQLGKRPRRAGTAAGGLEHPDAGLPYLPARQYDPTIRRALTRAHSPASLRYPDVASLRLRRQQPSQSLRPKREIRLHTAAAGECGWRRDCL
jgi:hypothetical protein